MADVVRYLRDSGSIVERDGVWVLARAEEDAFRELPASIRSMIARKIERLDEVDRKLLVAASVQDARVRLRLVAEAIEMDPAEVEERLDALEHVHVFVKRTRSTSSRPDAVAPVSVRPRALPERTVWHAPADAPCIAERPRRARARGAPPG